MYRKNGLGYLTASASEGDGGEVTPKKRSAAERKLANTMNVGLACPTCKNIDAQLNMYMDSNGSIVKDMVKRGIINILFPTQEDKEKARAIWSENGCEDKVRE